MGVTRTFQVDSFVSANDPKRTCGISDQSADLAFDQHGLPAFHRGFSAACG